MSACATHDRSVVECVRQGLPCRDHGDPSDAALILYEPERVMPRVYVASPYTLGGVEANVRASIVAGDRLVGTGLCLPILPLLSHLWEMESPHSYEFWIEYTKWLLVGCDYVVRLPGESAGADGEVKLAIDLGIPVFFDIEALIAHLSPQE